MNTHNDFNGATVVLLNHPGKNASLLFHLKSFYSKYMACKNTTSTQSDFTCLEMVRRGVDGVSPSYFECQPLTNY